MEKKAKKSLRGNAAVNLNIDAALVLVFQSPDDFSAKQLKKAVNKIKALMTTHPELYDPLDSILRLLGID